MDFTKAHSDIIWYHFKKANGPENKWCCKAWRLAGIEGLECYFPEDMHFDRMMLNFCPHCGNPLFKTDEKCGGDECQTC